MTTPTAATTTSESCSYPVSAATASVMTDRRLLRGTFHIWMKTASPNSGSDIHTLTPIAMSAARTQTDLTSTLRTASCAVPYA